MMATIIVAGFTACGESDLLSKEGGTQEGGKVIEGEPTYATFDFNVNNGPGTKATSATDAGAATAEKTVKNLRLIIFRTGNSTTCEINESYVNPSGADKDKTMTLLVSSGTKKVFVIANDGETVASPFDKSKVKPNETTLAQFYQMVEEDLGTPAGTAAPVTGVNIAKLVDKTNGYLMSNAANVGCEYILEGGVSAEDSRGAAAGTPSKNHFKIDINRVVAKAKVYYTDNNTLKTTDGVGELEDIFYGIRNINRSVNRVQKFSGDGAAVGATPWAPYYTLAEGWPAANREVLDNYKPYYFSGYEMKYAVKAKAVAEASPGEPAIYITENTSQVQRKGNSTYAAIKATFLPLKGKYVKAGGVTYNPTSEFMEVTGGDVDITSGQTLFMLLDGKGKISNNTLFIDENDARYAAYAVRHAAGLTTPWNGTLASIPADFNPFEKVSGAMTGTPLSEVKTYTNGECFYRLNFGKGDMSNNDMVYGVWRNHFYKAEITQFGGIGENDIEDLELNPEIPLGERTHVTATINVVDWQDGGSTVIL